MKEKVTRNFIKNLNKYSCYCENEIENIEYGFISLFNLVTKLIIIFIISIFLKLTNEMCLFMLIYIPLRSVSFGMHANNSIQCLIISTLLFLGIPFIALYIKLSLFMKAFLGINLITIVIKNSPAETKKRPIKNKKRITMYKLITAFICFSYLVIMLYTKNNLVSNLILFSLLVQAVLTSKTLIKEVNYENIF